MQLTQTIQCVYISNNKHRIRMIENMEEANAVKKTTLNIISTEEYKSN